MKVLQVNCVYNKGSSGKIVADMHNTLQKNGVESVVCYGRGKWIREKNIIKTCPEIYSKANHLLTYFTGVMYGGCHLSTDYLISVIKKEKPDVVHLHCINGYFVNIYRLVSWLKKNHIKTVATLHAEFMHTANCGYAYDCEKWKIGCGNCPRFREETKSLFFDRTHRSWKKMQKAFLGFDDDLVVTSVSPWLMERAKQSPIFQGKNHIVVYNGLDTEVFRYYDTSELKRKHGLTSERIIFHATSSFSLEKEHIKGGYFVNEIAKRFTDQNVKVIVAGQYPEGIQVADNVILLGRVTDQHLLAQYYSMADVTLLTSKRETFSMVTAESLACGTPVAGFRAGAPEQITIPEYSDFTTYGDVDALIEVVRTYFVRLFDKKAISDAGKKKFSREIMMERYYSLYSRLYYENGESRKNKSEIEVTVQ